MCHHPPFHAHAHPTVPQTHSHTRLKKSEIAPANHWPWPPSPRHQGHRDQDYPLVQPATQTSRRPRTGVNPGPCLHRLFLAWAIARVPSPALPGSACYTQLSTLQPPPRALTTSSCQPLETAFQKRGVQAPIPRRTDLGTGDGEGSRPPFPPAGTRSRLLLII